MIKTKGRGLTAVAVAAKSGDLRACSLALITDVSDINAQHKNGFTALHYACYNGFQDIAELLLKSGADPYQLNDFGETAADSARQGNHHLLADRIDTAYPSAQIAFANTDLFNSKYDEIVATMSMANRSSSIVPVPVPNTFSRSEAQRYKLVVESIEGDDLTCSEVGLEFSLLATRKLPSATSLVQSQPIPMLSPVVDDITIGRSRGNTIVLSDLSVSKNHAIISYFQDNGFFIRDLSSKHGSFLNGERVGPEHGVASMDSVYKLVEGVILKFGRVQCRVIKNKQDRVICSE